MEWKIVEKDGLPEKEFEEDDGEYLVVKKEHDPIHNRWGDGWDIATFHHNYGYVDGHWVTLEGQTDWKEVHITHWCKIEFPDDLN